MSVFNDKEKKPFNHTLSQNLVLWNIEQGTRAPSPSPVHIQKDLLQMSKNQHHKSMAKKIDCIWKVNTEQTTKGSNTTHQSVPLTAKCLKIQIM